MGIYQDIVLEARSGNGAVGRAMLPPKPPGQRSSRECVPVLVAAHCP